MIEILSTIPDWAYFIFFAILFIVGWVKFEKSWERWTRAKLIAEDPTKAIPISKQEIVELEAWLDERALPYAAMTIGDNPPADAHESRIGGPAAFLPDGKWPISENGKPMIFLAQINFAEIPSLPDYPETGLLQIFVADGGAFGYDFDDALDGGKKIVWYEDPEKASSLINPPNDPKSESPYQSTDVWMKGRAVTFQRGDMRPDWMHWTIEEKLKEFYHKPNDDEVFESLFDHEKPFAHYVGGYPSFAQDDIRSISHYNAYNRVLFQMGFDDHVCWGDAGEAMFMVTREDLLARNFDGVLYHWDCH